MMNKRDLIYYKNHLQYIEFRARLLELRYNHNHDERGRFASGGGGGSPVSSGNSAKSVDKSAESGIIINTGGKITDSNFTKVPEFEEQAKKFYNAMISNGDIDVKAISENTGFSYDDVLAIKNHIMIEEHLFKDGTIRKFDPDIDQALAWQRMMNGNPRDTDILLLNHELRELKYIRKTNCDYETAHAFSTEKYDWQTAKEAFIDRDNIDPKFLK